MPAARFDHRLEPTYGDRVEGEASGLGGAKAASGDEVELGVCVEQSERGYVGR